MQKKYFNYLWEEESNDCGTNGSSLLWEICVANSYEGTWSFNIAETEIRIEYEYYAEIVSLTDTELKYKFYDNVGGTNLTITITLGH